MFFDLHNAMSRWYGLGFREPECLVYPASLGKGLPEGMQGVPKLIIGEDGVTRSCYSVVCLYIYRGIGCCSGREAGCSRYACNSLNAWEVCF